VSGLDESLHAEADRLLDSGLRAALAEYGEVHPIGSYALRLMTWRDLDIHVVRGELDRDAFFALGAKIAHVLEPHRMHFRDERRVETPGLPRGLYWGVHQAGGWKVDIWAETPEAFERTRAFGERIAARLTETTREAILRIKAECWRHPEYRRGFTSTDIYDAVLDRGILDVESFWADLFTRRPSLR